MSTQVRTNQAKPEPGSKTAVVFRYKYHVGLFRMMENINKSYGEDWPREISFFESKEKSPCLVWAWINRTFYGIDQYRNRNSWPLGPSL